MGNRVLAPFSSWLVCASLIRCCFLEQASIPVGKEIIQKSGGSNYDKCSVFFRCLIRVEQS